MPLYNGLAFPADYSIFAQEWTRPSARASMLAQEWTWPHGQHAGLRPSWLAWLAYGQLGSPTSHVGTGTAGNRDSGTDSVKT